MLRMTITPEASAKTLTQLVATEIRVQMARADVRQSQLAREIGKTEQWLSVRLRGRQPIDVNDLALIAGALRVGVHELLPPPAVIATARVQTDDELKKNLAAPHLPHRNDHVRAGHGSPMAPQRRDSARPVSAVPASQRRPVSVRPNNRPIAT